MLNAPPSCLFIRNCKCSVVCLQETKLASTSIAKLRSFCGFYLKDFCTLDAIDSRGGILTAWNLDLFECLTNWSGSFSLNVILKRKSDNSVMMISNIYGPIDSSLKAVFFSELLDIRTLSPNVWAVLGDFNALFSIRDKNGPPQNVSSTLHFRAVINEIGLLDLPLTNRTYTWTNGRRNPTLVRLDRAFISLGRSSAFPSSTLTALPRVRWDHAPMFLFASSYIPCSSLFRFESF